jgi:hypothetical protein
MNPITRNVVDAWHACDTDTRTLGAAWYPRARAEARRLARTYGLSEARAAAIIAALSPRCQWSVNLAYAERVAAAYASGADCPRVSTTCFRALAWNFATRTLRPSACADQSTRGVGPKVSRFWRNILGARDVATLDTWACRVAGVPHSSVADERTYVPVELAFIEAAAIVGEDVRTVQAATWIRERGRHE